MSYAVPRWSQMAGRVSLLLVGTIVARLCTALSLVLIARQTGPAQFGQYTASFTLAWLTAPLFSLGLDMWLLGNGRRTGQDGELTVNASTALALKGGLGLLWLLLLIALAPLLNPAIFPPGLLWLAGVSVWLDEIARLVGAAFQAGERNRTVVWLLVVAQALVLAGVGSLALLGVEEIALYAWAQMATTVAGSGLGIFWLIRTFGFSTRLAQVRRTARAALPYGLSMFLSVIYGRADVMIVAYWLGATAAGYYSPAISILSALALLPLAVHNIVLPIFSQAEHRNPQALPRLIRQVLLASAGVGLLMGGGLLLSARGLIDLFYGDAYRATGVVLMIFSGVLVARCINMSAAAALIALHLQRKRVAPQAVAALFNLAVNLFVVQRWGIEGVAVVFVLTEGWLIFAYLWLVAGAVGRPRIQEV